MWSRKTNMCLSCCSNEWSHMAKGHCKKCYPIIKSIGIVRAWDEKDASTLKGIQGINLEIITVIKEVNFHNAKNEIIRQLELRLKIIKNAVNPENITPIDIEYTLDKLAEIVLKSRGKKLFHTHASFYEHFSTDQRKRIFKDLNLILLKKRFKLNISEILNS